MTLWRHVFGDDAPVEVEIGPGRGDVLVAFAAAAPERRFFGIERTAGMAEAIERRAAARGLRNLRAVGGDARCIVARVVPDASVAAYHVYFPDPWPKTRHRERRLFDDGFGRHLWRTLVPGGRLHVATDLPALFAAMEAALATSGLHRRPGVPPRERPRTRFETGYAAAGTHAGVWVRP